jgi:uncharacterized pyridoxamine 5'-phosphate oxidase family protein
MDKTVQREACDKKYYNIRIKLKINFVGQVACKKVILRVYEILFVIVVEKDSWQF